jgi:hypothetical protein
MKLQADAFCRSFAFSQDITSQFEDAYLASNRRLAEAFPGEFDDFATPGWAARGADFTENLADESLFRIFAQCLNYAEAKTEEASELRRYAEAKDNDYAILDRERLALLNEYELKTGQLKTLMRMRAEEHQTYEEQLHSPRFLARTLWQTIKDRLHAKLGG